MTLSTLPTLAQVFSLRMFLFGWSYFWRGFLLLQLPYFIVYGVHKIAVGGLIGPKADAMLLLIVSMWLVYFVWAVYANGLILNRMQKAQALPNQYSANSFVVGAKMVVALIVFAVVFFIPAYVIGFVVSFVIGLALGFHSFPNAEIVGASRVAVYFANSFVSVFVLGYVTQQVIAHQLNKENKQFVAPTPVV